MVFFIKILKFEDFSKIEIKKVKKRKAQCALKKIFKLGLEHNIMGILKRLLKKEAIILFFLIIIFLPFINASVITELNISRIPPILLKTIPNQSWAINSGIANAFDLDEYFQSYDGLSLLSYTYSYVENVSIVIDSSNVVSFYSDLNFSGVRNVTFIADDEGLNSTSNKVFLFVGTDNEPPKWSSPARSKIKIYQNDYVNFSASWTDNFQLKKYMFSINQGSGWSDYPQVNFSGIQNTSLYRVQISAPGGSVVYWKFCANDTSDNTNCTDEQVFNVTSWPVPPGGGGGAGEGAGEGGGEGAFAPGAAASSSQIKKISNFSLDPLYFKVSLKQGATETRILKITNIGNSNLLINLSVLGLEKFIRLSKENFELSFGETEKITIDFYSKNDTFPEQYFGKIILNSNAGSAGVPVVLDVTPFDVAIDIKVNISDKYKTIIPGKIIYANVTIYNLKDINTDKLTLYTAIKDLYGNIYDSSQEKISLISIYSAEKNLTVPLGAQEGEYIFYARVSNDKISNIDSDIFEVGQKFRLGSFLKSFFIFLFITVLSFLFLILLFKYKREKEREKLLNLYLMLNELKELIKQEKVDQAIELYIRIKNVYGEPVSRTALDKERLKAEINDLSKKLNSQIEESGENIKEISKEAKEAIPKPKDVEEKPSLKPKDVEEKLISKPKEINKQAKEAIPKPKDVEEKLISKPKDVKEKLILKLKDIEKKLISKPKDVKKKAKNEPKKKGGKAKTRKYAK